MCCKVDNIIDKTNIPEDKWLNSSKRKQSQRLIFQQSRSERSSLDGEQQESTTNMHSRKNSWGTANQQNSSKNSMIGKFNKKIIEISKMNDKSSNAFANNRRILTSASNASDNFPKNNLLILNSNRRNNAYQEEGYSIKSKKDSHSIESKGDSGSGGTRVNYFGNRNLRKSEINFNRDANESMKKELSFKDFVLRRKSENDNKNKNYYTPENIESKKTKTNNYMSKDGGESIDRVDTKQKRRDVSKASSNNPQDESYNWIKSNKLEYDLRPLTKQKEIMSIKRPLDQSLERNMKKSGMRVETDPDIPSIFMEDMKKNDKSSIETDKIKHSSYKDSESDEAIINPESRKFSWVQKRNSFDSFDKKEENKFQKVDEQKVPIDSSKYLKPSSAKNSKSVTLNEKIIKEREDLIKFTKDYIKKNNELPPTTLDYYEFVKCIGKGAFGKVTLGIHKLTGKYVAIKTIDKTLMKDEFSKRKVFQEVYILK